MSRPWRSPACNPSSGARATISIPMLPLPAPVVDDDLLADALAQILASMLPWMSSDPGTNGTTSPHRFAGVVARTLVCA